jgi:Ca2+-binding RTX toxin-like protein
VEGQSFIPSPHFTSIAASFGSLLEATEVGKAQSVVVTTEGVPDSTTLTLDINSTLTYTALVSGNTATFLIPAGDLSGLNAGVDLLQVSGTTTTGTTIPSMSQAFSVDGPAPSNTPHFTSIDPTFGAVLDSSEAATNQTIGVISTGLTDGQVLQMQLNGIQYTASVSSNNASFTIPAAELQALPRGTDTLLVNAPGTATPQGSQSFTVTAPSSGGGSTGCCCTTTGGDDLLIKGGSGADTLTGGSGDDTISGGQGDDIIRGCSGDDTLSGGKGQDTLRGSSGDDLLKGHTFHDTLHGGSGDDTLIGGKGQDILIGGKGSDTFQLSKGNDTIRDFSITNGDVIDAPNNLNLQLIQRDDHLLLKDSDHNIKTRLLNINRDDLLSYQPELLG